jgi:hypothetical protein
MANKGVKWDRLRSLDPISFALSVSGRLRGRVNVSDFFVFRLKDSVKKNHHVPPSKRYTVIVRVRLYVYVCLSACLSAYLSIYLSIYLSVCMHVYIDVCMYACMFVCLSIRPSKSMLI